MTNEESVRLSRIAVHKMLHQGLDELIADYLTCNYGKTPGQTTVAELMQWSHQQTIEPDTPEVVRKRRQAWLDYQARANWPNAAPPFESGSEK